MVVQVVVYVAEQVVVQVVVEPRLLGAWRLVAFSGQAEGKGTDRKGLCLIPLCSVLEMPGGLSIVPTFSALTS